MSKSYVYRIRNKTNNTFFEGYSYFGSHGKEYKTESGARSAIEYFVSSRIGRKSFETGKVTAEALKELFPYDLEIVKTEIVRNDVGATSLETHVRNVILSRRLNENAYHFGQFWQNALKKGYADDIQFIVHLKREPGTARSTMIKDARAQLRLLGIKTRTFKEFNGMFGFYNRDQAFKARLTLDVDSYIDVSEIRKDVFE